MKQILLKLSRACAENAAHRYIATFINIIKLFALRAAHFPASSLPLPPILSLLRSLHWNCRSCTVIPFFHFCHFSQMYKRIFLEYAHDFFRHSFYPQPIIRSDFSLTLSYKYFHFICVMVNYSLLMSFAYMYVWITLEHAQIFFHYSFYPARARSLWWF